MTLCLVCSDMGKSLRPPYTDEHVHELVGEHVREHARRFRQTIEHAREHARRHCTVLLLLSRCDSRVVFKMDAHAVVAIFGGFVSLGDERKRKLQKIWCKNWLKNRNRFSQMSLLAELAANEPNDYKNYLKMTENCFEDILRRISPAIEKQNTSMKEAISCKERLAATLQFLVSGRSYENLKFSCAKSPQSLGKIIPETCTAIYNALREEYLNVSTAFI